jgi:hypothetical protein
MAMEEVPYFVRVTRAALPLVITKAATTQGELTISGENWCLSSDCAWRVASNEGFIFGSRSKPTNEQVLALIGQSIQHVEPSGFANLDFSLHLSDGTVLEIFTDTDFVPWILSLPNSPLIVADGTRA